MHSDPVQYVSATSLMILQKEYETLKTVKIPEIAKRIDEAKQQGDLSENAEYHQAREDMAWARGRLQELEQIIQNAQIISHRQHSDTVGIGSTVAVRIKDEGKTYTIVGPQEINPAKGFISNESPLGEAFLGHRVGDTVMVKIPSGEVAYKILAIS